MKQAHSLIAMLIKDSDVDILQMLPKPSKASSTTTTLWDKTQIGVSTCFLDYIASIMANAEFLDEENRWQNSNHCYYYGDNKYATESCIIYVNVCQCFNKSCG